MVKIEVDGSQTDKMTELSKNTQKILDVAVVTPKVRESSSEIVEG